MSTTTICSHISNGPKIFFFLDIFFFTKLAKRLKEMFMESSASKYRVFFSRGFVSLLAGHGHTWLRASLK